MTITITPETEELLRQKAQREGADVNTVAETLLATILRWEAQEREDTIEGIRRGLEASDAGRVRPFAEFAAQIRAQYHLPTHLSDEQVGADK